MRPIASLTETAQEIATTRDPSKRMPDPVADDEVGKLARTLEEMLGRSTPPGPNARRRCRSSANSSPTPRTSCARR